MSDSEPKKYERKTFFSRVCERTRSKRDTYCEITHSQSHSHSHRTCSSSQNAVHGSGGISRNEHKRKLWGYSSSCYNNIDKSGLAASQDNAREHKRRRLVKPAAGVGARINHSGKKRDDVNKKEPMIKIINESEFSNKNICSASGIRRSTMQGLNKGFYAASSWKKDNISSKKPFAFVEIPSEYASHRRLLHQQGNGNEDSDSEEIEIIDKDEFMSQNSCSMSKVGPSSKEKLKASFSAATTRKNASNVIMESSAGYCESFCPEDAFHGSDHASRPFIQIGRDTDNMIPEDEGIKGIDEAEFRNQKKHFESNIRRSAEQARCAACSCKNVDGAKKNVSSADRSVTFRHKEYCTGPDMLADNSSTLAKKVNNNEPMSCRKTKIKREDEGELKNGKSSTNSKRGAFTRQGYSAVSSKKNANIVKELSIDSYCGSFSEHAGRDSHKEQANRSRAFAETVNSDEDTDPEELGIEEVDESEFRKRRQFVVSEIGSSTRQERNEGQFASTSAKNVNRVSEKIPSTEKIDKNKRKRKVSSYSESKKKGEVGYDEVDSSTSEFTDSHSSSESNGDDVTTSLQDDEVSSCGANNGMGLGVASRTRSKMGSIRKPASLSIDSDSSPTDSGYHNINCEDFKVESSDDGIERLACDVQDNKLVVSVEKDEDCNKQGSCAVENASEPSHKSFQSKESNCEQPVLESQKFSSGKRHLSDDASSKPAAEGKAGKICEFQVENEERDQTFCDVAEAEEGLKERNNGCDEELHPVDQSQEGVRRPKKAAKEGKSHKTCEVEDDNQKGCDEVNRVPELHPNDQTQTRMRRPKKAAAEAHKKCGGREEKKEMGQTFSLKERNISQKSGSSKDSFTKKGCDGVNELHLKEQSQAGMRRAEKEDLPSHSKIDCDQSDDDEEEDTPEKTEATSSVPTGRDQMSSEHYDLCSMLADVVLGRGQMTENDIVKGDEENHGECKQDPASQTQDTLPLKFRFEDEVPEPVEKTEYEKEIDGLFSELDCNWALEDLRAFDYPEVNLENENSPAEETQHERCSRGKHELVLEDDEGLICIFCRHVVLGPKDVLPEWVERTYQDSRRRNSETERTLEFDELHLQSSIDNVSDCNATGTVWSIKPGVRESMYEHQQEGFEFLWKNLAGSINLDELKSTNPGGVGGCIISHAPGTGKTRLTIVFVETYLKMFPNCRPVIISPASMLLTWEEEFRKWNVGYPFLNLNNSELAGKEKNAVGHLAPAKSRDMESIRMIKIFSWSRGGSILGISYSLFEKLIGEKHIKGKSSKKREILNHKNTKMRQILLEMPGLVVLDEGHTPRNQRSNIWNALLKLKTQKRVILSGTPFQNNFVELFNTLRLVRPSVADVLVQEKTYADMVATRRTGRKHKGGHSQPLMISEVVDRAVENLKLCMSPFVHLHKGTILQQSLPGLRDCVVVLKPPTLQKSLIERIQGSNNFKFEHEVALISVHPYLFLHCESKEDQMTGINMDAVGACKLNPQEGVKTRFILELVRLSMAVKEKVLVFSQYIQPLELIKEQLEEIFKWVDGKQILRMKGKLEQKQRQILINLFNDPMSEAKIMLASTRCCSEGISLIGASRVVLLDVVWNPSVERQAISRAYRIGQKKFVYTYHLMTSGTTESDKYCRQTEKERLSELVFSSGNEQKHLRPLGMEDRILEVMVAHQSLKGMFEKIINQPKDTDLIQTFGLTS